MHAFGGQRGGGAGGGHTFASNPNASRQAQQEDDGDLAIPDRGDWSNRRRTLMKQVVVDAK